MTDWPVDLSEFDLRMRESGLSGRAAQMAALESAGMVKGVDTEIEEKGMFPTSPVNKRKVKRYTLVDGAKPFTREFDANSFGMNGNTTVKKTDLCWGKQALDKIVKWKGPMTMGSYQEAVLIYTYKVNNTADWAKRADVQAAFPQIKNMLDAAGKNELPHAAELTSEGWEPKGLD